MPGSYASATTVTRWASAPCTSASSGAYVSGSANRARAVGTWTPRPRAYATRSAPDSRSRRRSSRPGSGRRPNSPRRPVLPSSTCPSMETAEPRPVPMASSTAVSRSGSAPYWSSPTRARLESLPTAVSTSSSAETFSMKPVPLIWPRLCDATTDRPSPVTTPGRPIVTVCRGTPSPCRVARSVIRPATQAASSSAVASRGVVSRLRMRARPSASATTIRQLVPPRSTPQTRAERWLKLTDVDCLPGPSRSTRTPSSARDSAIRSSTMRNTVARLRPVSAMSR